MIILCRNVTSTKRRLNVANWRFFFLLDDQEIV